MMQKLACLLALVTTATPLSAQVTGLAVSGSGAAPADESPPRRLTVSPAAAPEPALKYQLLPELKDQKPGNGALLYQRAHSPEWWSKQFRRPIEPDKMNAWLEVPLKQLPRAEMRYLENWAGLREVDQAARRQFCDWEMTERARTEGISMLLPDVQSFREYAMFLGMRARLEMADGHLDRAVYTLQTGMALARDVANAPTLINALVALAIAQQMADRLEDLMQVPGAPNLYWALAALPDPFIDLRKPLQGERLLMEAEFPELKTIASTVWGAQQQQNFMVHFQRLTDLAGGWGFNVGSNVNRKLAFTAAVIKTYPESREFLLSHGRQAAEVDAMPVLQVVLIYSLHNYNRIQDDYAKWMGFPYWQARADLDRADRDMRSTVVHMRMMPFGDFVPAMHKSFEARVRLDRRLAALRCIEAIRLHAAAHDGKLPASLRDITVVPVPVDPVSGRDFDYAVNGDRFTLRESRSADGVPVLLPYRPLNYEVTFRR